MLQALSDEGVESLLVGAYALAAHGYPRATMDIDLWVKPSPSNAQLVMLALSAEWPEAACLRSCAHCVVRAPRYRGTGSSEPRPPGFSLSAP